MMNAAAGTEAPSLRASAATLRALGANTAHIDVYTYVYSDIATTD